MFLSFCSKQPYDNDDFDENNNENPTFKISQSVAINVLILIVLSRDGDTSEDTFVFPPRYAGKQRARQARSIN